jgi:outer membrane lipoprotein LolB
MPGLSRRMAGGALLGAVLGMLSACATTPLRSTQTPGAGGVPIRLRSGRLGVQVAGDAQRSFSAAFELTGDASTGELSLTSPIGTRLALARWTTHDALLETSDSTRLFPDLNALATEVFREDIPLVALLDWLDGRPWAGADSTALAAPAIGFQQLGWEVRLDRQAEDGLVVAVRAAAPSLTVRARLDRP